MILVNINANTNTNMNDGFDDEINPLIPNFEEEKPLTIGELKINYMRSHLQSKKPEYCKVRNLS